MDKIYGKAHIGLTSINTFGTVMKIIDYINGRNVVIEFQDEHKYQTVVDMANFMRGHVANPYDRTVVSHGFIGVGDYSKKDDRDCYICWRNMLVRCFDEEYQNKYTTYKKMHKYVMNGLISKIFLNGIMKIYIK